MCAIESRNEIHAGSTASVFVVLLHETSGAALTIDVPHIRRAWLWRGRNALPILQGAWRFAVNAVRQGRDSFRRRKRTSKLESCCPVACRAVLPGSSCQPSSLQRMCHRYRPAARCWATDWKSGTSAWLGTRGTRCVCLTSRSNHHLT